MIPRAVAEHKVTCTASPWQAQGRLWDGPVFYLRLRSGVASLGFGATHDEAVADATWGERHWQDFDDGELWHPTDDQAWAWFERLLAMRRL